MLRGGSNRAAILNDNVARQGGGAYVVDLGSNLATVDAWVIGSLATEDGGAAFVRDGGLLEMSRTLGESCHDPVRCSRLALNHAGQAGSPGRGGAVFVDGEMGCGGDGEGDPCSLTGAGIARTYIEENSVEDHEDSRGSVGFAQDHTFRDGNTVLAVGSSILARNRNGREVLFSSDQLLIQFSTITANTATRALTMLIDDQGIVPGFDATSRLVLGYSTIWDEGATLEVLR